MGGKVPGSSGARGITTLLVLVFMGIFMLIIVSLTSYALEQSKVGRALLSREQALSIAESGLDYYDWFLGHFPNNLTDGTGRAGPYTYTVSDPEGATLGTASISVSANTQCNVIQSIDITSKGVAGAAPQFPRTLFARYMQKSVAWYSYVLNSAVEAGSDLAITGPYFDNAGIRMDATNLSDVDSAVSTWDCNASYGCSPEQTRAPGVVGSGPGSALWHYPAASISFGGMTSSFSSLKSDAQSGGGLYFPALSGNANQRGYHFVFLSNGTVNVYQVTSTTNVPSITTSPLGADLPTYANSYCYQGYCYVGNEYSLINAQTYVGNYAVPSSCSLIFVNDRAWVEGVVKGKVTLVAADTTNSNNYPDIFISNNITYPAYDGTNGLTLIASGDILLTLTAPSAMELHGIFVSVNGSFGRNFYTTDSADYGSYAAPSSYSSYILGAQLITDGTIVSSGRTGTAWASGATTVSGYQNRINSYDELQATDPPPFTPSASASYGFVLWKEE